MRWSLREHQKEPHRLSDLLYWQQLLDPDGSADVVTQTDCSLFSTVAYRGVDLESASDLEKMVRRQQFHEVLLSLAPAWGIHGEVRRRRADPYPQRRWPHPTAALVDTEREAQMQAAHYETEYRLTFTNHVRGLGQSWQHLLWEHIPEELSPMAPSRLFREEMARLVGDLGGVLPAVTRLRAASLLTYLKSTISLVDQQVDIPDPPWFLGCSLSDQSYDSGVAPRLGDFYLRVIGVRNKRQTRQVGYPA